MRYFPLSLKKARFCICSFYKKGGDVFAVIHKKAGFKICYHHKKGGSALFATVIKKALPLCQTHRPIRTRAYDGPWKMPADEGFHFGDVDVPADCQVIRDTADGQPDFRLLNQ